jgi:Domain of unknown function (DUF4164)
MSNAASPLSLALQRLGSAIDQLDAAASRKHGSDRANAARATELEMMRGDRAKLAELLDQALLRGRGLETVTLDVSDRVDRAIDLVRSALELQSSQSEG